MSKDELIEFYVDEILEFSSNPLSRPLEVGFRHTDLTTVEVIQRYKETCQMILTDIEQLRKLLNE